VLQSLITDLYKSQSSRLLAVLTRLFGAHNLELAEDVLQYAFSQALVHWQEGKVPEKPHAWLMQTAKNKALDLIRTQAKHIQFSDDLQAQLSSEWTLEYTLELAFQQDNIKDDMLRMIFVCCHASIKPENRLAFILKTLCGFSLQNISRALLVPTETVKKRLVRTRKQLKGICFKLPESEDLPQAMDTAHQVLYLLFNEGFYSTDSKQAIRLEFCQEAVALLKLLADEATLANRDTLALLALMHFHLARLPTRVDESGFSVPLNLQDRSVWHLPYIHMGAQLIAVAQKLTPGLSPRFLLEAQICELHCAAKTFEDTNWYAICRLYQQLEQVFPSPMTQLNLAIALGYCQQLREAISIVENLVKDKTLANLHSPWAVLAHLQARAGNKELAYGLAEKSRNLGGTPHEQQLMLQQLERLLES